MSVRYGLAQSVMLFSSNEPLIKSVLPKAMIPMDITKTTRVNTKIMPYEPIFINISRSYLLQSMTQITNKNRAV